MYIACGYTDLRRGIDGLAAMVQQEFSLDPFTNTLFLFCDRRRDRIKALYWEGNGFVLLDSGCSEQRVGHLAQVNRDLIRLCLEDGKDEKP